MKIAIGIVGHTSRLTMAEALASTVNADYVSIDDGTLGCEGNHRKVWSTLATKNTDWTVVLEDDAIPVDEFRAQSSAALTQAPSDVVSFYLGNPSWWHWYPDRRIRLTQAGKQADDQAASWILSNDILHGVATAIRTTLISEMLTHIEGTTKPIDYAIRQWVRANDRHIAFSWPSLVDHADTPTLIRHQDGLPRTAGQRKAWRHGRRTHWTNKAVTDAQSA